MGRLPLESEDCCQGLAQTRQRKNPGIKFRWLVLMIRIVDNAWHVISINKKIRSRSGFPKIKGRQF